MQDEYIAFAHPRAIRASPEAEMTANSALRLHIAFSEGDETNGKTETALNSGTTEGVIGICVCVCVGGGGGVMAIGWSLKDNAGVGGRATGGGEGVWCAGEGCVHCPCCPHLKIQRVTLGVRCACTL